MSCSDSVLSINSDDTWNWDNDKSEHQTLSNPQSDSKKGSGIPDSGYRFDNDPGQQDSKIVALSSC
ncbi:hypothetical protein [Wolbachia pipientis]|uniref:hypothetical protein n=1 Tax=Wolbachia pipientis TaxID=955 RepID=UPI0025A425DC|nr:hypothetical protein [Wolbachia pipientis]MDM8334936.1 hypothetical protein [Wolbachia pipientis]